MKKFLCIIWLFLPLFCIAQSGSTQIRTKSWETFVFRVSAAEVESYINQDSIPVNNFLGRNPFLTFKSDILSDEALPIGNYVLLGVKENYICASIRNISRLELFCINNRDQLQLFVYDSLGNTITNCNIYVNNKEAPLNNNSGTFWIKQYNIENTVVKVYAPGDTLFSSVAVDNYSDLSIPAQNRKNFKKTTFYKIIHWLPYQLGNLLKPKRSSTIAANGYVIFNQPKYKPLDTVKFKAYIVDKKWKQYKKEVAVFLNYYGRGKYQTAFIQNLRPVSPAAYTGQFIIADSIPLNSRSELVFKTKSGKNIIKNNLRIEEYVLDEIGTYEIRSEKTVYFRNDSLVFFAEAKDANGLNILDATASFYLLTRNIKKTYQDTLFVPDTLYQKEIKLSATGETKITVPASLLPKANLDITVKLFIKNSNNELQEKTQNIEFNYSAKDLVAKQDEDSITVSYIENGIDKSAKGFMEMNDGREIAISFPARIKIDPRAKDYYFSMEDETDYLDADVEINSAYRPMISILSKRDTLGFVLYNPYKIPIYYTVFDNKKIIATGSGTGNITWKKKMYDRRKALELRWQCIWAGEEKNDNVTLGLFYKILNIKVRANEKVYPGQDDSVHIHITDYKDKPASKVNLTAVSYNNQFTNISVKEPPYLVKYKGGRLIERDKFINEELNFSEKRYLLGKNKEWISSFHLDTMTYYKMLFPPGKYYDAVTPVENFVPQLSVNIVDKGVPQEIYLLYINNQLVYYNGTTDSMKYVFQIYPGMLNLKIRTIDRVIEIDSIYIQPRYKHDISFDMNNLPEHSKTTPAAREWSNAEIALLENSILQMKNRYYNNRAYVWQDATIVKLASDIEHLIGPFKQLHVQFFNPSHFDIAFTFEPGYQYDFSSNVSRLEKKSLFPKRDKPYFLPIPLHTYLKYGDTLPAPPLIAYPVPKKEPYLLIDEQASNYLYQSALSTTGKLELDRSRDSLFKYFILLQADSNKKLVLPVPYSNRIHNIPPGKYSILLVTNNNFVCRVNDIEVRKDGTEYVRMKRLLFSANDTTLKKLFEETALEELQRNKPDSIIKEEQAEITYTPISQSVIKDVNGGSVSGIIKDAKGENPIAFCSVSFKGYSKSFVSDAAGKFEMSDIKPGKYVLVFSVVGYDKKEVEVVVQRMAILNLDIRLTINNQELTSVVVTALGQVRQQKEQGYSTVKIKNAELTSVNIQNGLAGQVSGLNVKTSSNGVFSDEQILLRGMRSLSDDNKPLYVVNGIIVDDINKINPNSIIDVTILKSEESTAIYGSRGANGVIIITTDDNKTFRKEFRDYAFWEPNFFTDNNGNASFKVTYPDNITGWRTFIIAMDKKRRVGRKSFLTQAYKPVSAQLSLPQFLINEDSCGIIGKSLNYTNDNYSVKTTFILNGNSKSVQQKDLLSNASNVEEELIVADNTDTMKTSFTLETTTGFKDGEERRIPVFKKGVMENIGNFWILEKDTSIAFSISTFNDELNIYAENNTLDVLLDELKHLRDYPFACMEQMASKINGLSMEKEILEQLKKPFHDQKILDRLLQKIQKAQLYDGGWPWWENGKSNFYITNYVARVLLAFRENPLVEANIRNAFTWIYNELNFSGRDKILASLLTLSEGKFMMDYNYWMSKIPFDSLSQHQQWQWVKIRQQQKLSYTSELKKLVSKKTEVMLGAIHWGEDNFSWYGNDVATTVIAFSVLENEPGYKNMLPAIVRYFLEKKRRGYWSNTVESASIINAILSFILEKQNYFTQPAIITINGDSSFVINNFPYKMVANKTSIRNISISKSGGGLVYFTAYQKVFNTAPEPVNDRFDIQTSFQRNGQNISMIRSGEKIKMIIEVKVFKDADYVMLSVPIPAGCLYSNKKNNDWRMNREYYKDKMVLFIESLPKGMHKFEVELESRYNGTYTLNPAKAELMYYPTFFGRNELKRVTIAK